MVLQQPEILKPTFQLKKHEIDRFTWSDAKEKPIATPSEWFSKKFPLQAQQYGTPFLEAVYDQGFGIHHVTPISMNEEFFASILGGDERLGHTCVFYQPEEQFYFKDPREDGIFKHTTEAKLRTLLSMYLLRCAEEMPLTTDKTKLFKEFRSDRQLQSVIIKARSILAADKSFFGLDSPHVRKEGAEAYGKVAKTFIETFMEPNPGKSMTVGESYEVFKKFCEEQKFVLMSMRVFRELVATLIQREYGLGLRNDVLNPAGKQQRGWRGIGLREYTMPASLLQRN